MRSQSDFRAKTLEGWKVWHAKFSETWQHFKVYVDDFKWSYNSLVETEKELTHDVAHLEAVRIAILRVESERLETARKEFDTVSGGLRAARIEKMLLLRRLKEVEAAEKTLEAEEPPKRREYNEAKEALQKKRNGTEAISLGSRIKQKQDEIAKTVTDRTERVAKSHTRVLTFADQIVDASEDFFSGVDEDCLRYAERRVFRYVHGVRGGLRRNKDCETFDTWRQRYDSIVVWSVDSEWKHYRACSKEDFMDDVVRSINNFREHKQ
jgi:hypothetical protein